MIFLGLLLGVVLTVAFEALMVWVLIARDSDDDYDETDYGV